MKRILLITALSLVGQFGLVTGNGSNANGYTASQKDSFNRILREDKKRDELLKEALDTLPDKSKLIVRKNKAGNIKLVSQGVDGDEFVIEEFVLGDDSLSNLSFECETDSWWLAAISCNDTVLEYAEKETKGTGEKPGRAQFCFYSEDDSPTPQFCFYSEDDSPTPWYFRYFTKIPENVLENVLNEIEKSVCKEKGLEEQCKYVRRFKPRFLEVYKEACNRYKASNTTS